MIDTLKITLIVAAIWLAGCAGPPKPAPIPREVMVPVSVPCVVDPGPDPTYPDTDAALAATPDVASGVKLLMAGRILRMAREGEWKAAASGCRAPP